MAQGVHSGQRGFLDFSPTRRDYTDKENDVPVLSLIQFSKAPFVTFGSVKLGTSKSAVLRIENPTEYAAAEVSVDKIPSSKGFSVDCSTNCPCFQPGGSFTLVVTWTPTEEGGIRELIVLNANGVLKHQAVLLGRAEAPKRKKKTLWDTIKSKREGEKMTTLRRKVEHPPLKMAANKTFQVSRNPQYKRDKPRSPLTSLNEGKGAIERSLTKHSPAGDRCLKSDKQKALNLSQEQKSLVLPEKENVQQLSRNSPLVLLVPAAQVVGSGSVSASPDVLAGKPENKDLTKILNRTLSPIGTPERFKKLMPWIESENPLPATAKSAAAAADSELPRSPLPSLKEALFLIDSDLIDVNTSPPDNNSSCDFSDSLESNSEKHGCRPDTDVLKASSGSPELSESSEPRLIFFVSKKAEKVRELGVSEADKLPERTKKGSFTSATVTKGKAPVEANSSSGRKIKKSRRRLLQKTLELSDGISPCELGPGSPSLPVIDSDKGISPCDDKPQVPEFISSSTSLRLAASPFLLLFTGAPSRKAPGAPSMKTAKVIAVAQSKLSFIKPAQTALPRHPMPFAAKNMFYDERWIEKQERGFTWWINYVLTPDDFKVNTEVAKVNAVSLAMGGDGKYSVPKAPTKEEMSFSTYTARRKLNRLRRSACQLFTSDAMVKAIQRLELEVEARRLLVRKDRHLWKDIGERKKVLNWLLSYNPLWLRIGLETIYGELISLESNSDTLGLAVFILQRLLWNPDIAAEFRHPRVPHLYKDGHEEALSRFTLKKLLLLVCFLDKAKESRLIEHDPCLFCVDAEFKASKDLLLAFSRDFLSGEGILPRHLSYLGLPVSHVQTPLDEFDFAVKNLAVDLKCGVRLVRVMELLVQDWSLSVKLRLPAISRLQKVHNVDVALQVLKSKGIDLKDERGSTIDSRDIVDGHREKTLSLLWKIIFAFHVILNEDQLKEEIGFLKKTLRTKRRLASLKADRGLRQTPAKTRVPYEHGCTKVTLLMDWVRSVCDFYNLQVENFTVTFSDGRVLCYLIHHYHPGLLPEASVSHRTTQTVECSPRGRLELSCSASDSDSSFDSLPTGPDSPSLEFKELLKNEKSNFKLVNSAVSFLGGVPAMINPADMSNTIPNEKVVMSYLSFLCARLLDLRDETRAARVIQGAWRKYKLKKDLELYKVCAAVLIQQKYRATLLSRKTKNEYNSLRAAVLTVQANWRGRVDRKRIEKWHQCASFIQACYRRHKVQAQYRAKRAAAVVLQSHYRAYLALARMFLCRKRYLLVHSAAIAIQSRYRALLLCRATVKIQAVFRGFRERQDLKSRHKAARAIQAHFRMHRMRVAYLALKCAAIIIQERYRAKRLRDQQMQSYGTMKHAVIIIQAAYRGHKARRKIANMHQAASVIQRKFLAIRDRKQFLAVRVAVLAFKFQAMRLSAIIIQRCYRARVLQRQERAKFLKLKQSTIVLQAAMRGWRVRRDVSRQNHALWRGHCSRRLNDNPKIVKLRHRLRLVTASVREEDRLCNKTSSALDYLLRYKHFSYILEALKNLETATRLSPECCERLVESGATNVIFTLIRCCNRSVPCMDVITFSIQILLNLSKYHKTIEAVYSVENSVETLLDLLQRYREKAGDKVAEKGGSIFTKACFLLALLLQDKQRTEEVKKLPKVLDRIHSIYRLTARKHKMDTERTIIKQKMSASINGSFFVPATPRKSRAAPKFAPDWVLRRDKLKDIVDPLRAIQVVANTLSIVL
uniref:Assembly factor for spindle microtubules n=1 Tax=Oreochromis niloticus TaxID=8128 RepID=I3J7C8_ORENI